ncbi:hypothetical protein IJ541_03195 [bacterium]|nr:hypothetical protein [bacterium]
MKVNFENGHDKNKVKNAVSFEGYKFVKSEQGFNEIEFSYPFDPDKEDCYVEIYKLAKDDYGNYYTTGRAYSKKGQDRIPINNASNRIDLAKTFGIDDNQAFAYHFLLVDKHSHFTKTRVDAGDIIDERRPENENRNIFNVVTPNKSKLSRGSSMKLVIIDSQHVGWVYNDQNKVVFNDKLARRAENGIKTVTNKFGGTLAGLEHAIDNGEYDSYGRIISLPIFTDDDFTAHAYWNKNCMQMASSLGNINNYASLQRKMFAHGLNFVSDGAFVNEGLEGVHFKHILKWGEDSPYYNWFRASGIKDGPLSMGVFAKNKEYVSHKIVNSPYSYSTSDIGEIVIKKNLKYDSKKPTYIQFFDTRLVTDSERNDTTSLIKTYSKMSTNNVFDLHSHNDSIFPYAFEINPETYNKNIKILNEYNDKNPDNKIDITSPKAARILSKFENFVVDGKFESGFETWDANPDIAKLNFVYSNADAKALKNLSINDRQREMRKILRGNMQVRDYVVTSGKYWTQKTDDILRLHVAQNLKNINPDNPSQVYENILSIANNKILPKSVKAEVSKAEVENILDGLYNNKRKLSSENKKSQILEGLMNTPLDSFEFGDNLVSVLASPLISKRAVKANEIGVSRYEIFKRGNINLSPEYEKTYKEMDKIYTTEMYAFAENVLKNVDSTLPNDRKLFDGDKVTEYGKYVLPIITSEIAKYAVIKSLSPKNTVTIDNETGEISYDYKKLKQVSLQTIGITNPSSPEDEARMLLSAMKNGMKKLDSSLGGEISESIIKTLKGTNLQSFQLADLIIDKTQSGLDWRIDAAKDIADVEALRNKNTNFDYTWKSIANFWKTFANAILSVNPHAYIVAEVTNDIDMFNAGYGGNSRNYPKTDDIIPKFLRESGITSIAEYSFLFRDVSKMFGRDFEDGSKFDDSSYMQKILFEKMVGKPGQKPFLRTGALDAIMFAYTFIGNHDKPRALHSCALDLGLFYCDLTYNNEGNMENRRKAYQIINDKFLEAIDDNEVRKFDFSAVSPKAIAMADAIRPAFVNVLNRYRDEHHYSKEDFDRAFIPISKAVSDLAQGKFLDSRFDPDAFGVKPFDVTISMVLKQAKEKYGFRLPGNDAENYENEVFEAAMKPALSKLLGMMKILVALPGMPTLFDGDDAGATGWDTKTKNMFVQGRQRIHHEWLDASDDRHYKEFLAKYKGYFDEVMGVRQNPKCNALNNGAVYTLPLNKTQSGELVTSILRQSTDGRMAISIFNPTGMHNDFRREYRQNKLYLDRLYFTDQGDGMVGISGIRQGTRFVNAKDENDLYYTRIDENGNYYLTRHYDGKDVPMPIDDTTLILYHVPEGGIPLTFTGNCLVKPKVSDITRTYSTNNVECGKKLALIK